MPNTVPSPPKTDAVLNADQTIAVMIVDNHLMVASGIKHMLEDTNKFTVSAIATNATEALVALESVNPDLILLEPNMPDANGFDLIPMLLQRCSAKILVITSLDEFESHDQAIVNGARGVLKKSDPAEMLIKAAEKIHDGELWINREATSRILLQIAQITAKKELSPEEIKLNSLTAKEVKVSRLLHANSDLTLKEISALLHISEHTLRNHLSSIYQKLLVKNRLEFYVFASKYFK
jgi:two-component system nitrate/nitrite response regulator NarL